MAHQVGVKRVALTGLTPQSSFDCRLARIFMRCRINRRARDEWGAVNAGEGGNIINDQTVGGACGPA